MVGIKVSNHLKQFLQQQAKSENRTLSSFILNAVLTYTKEHKGIDWKEPDSEK